jgi:hypothetical protein
VDPAQGTLLRKAAEHSKALQARVRRTMSELETWSDERFVDWLGSVIRERPQLAAYADEVTTALRWAIHSETTIEMLAGRPSIRDLAGETALAAAARSRVFDRGLLDANAVSKLMGSRSRNRRQYAAQLRRRGEILGVPVRGRQFGYPAFQFDRRTGSTFKPIAPVNRLLDASADPWGVASWWVSPNARLRNQAPRELLGKKDDAILEAAAAEVEDAG